MSDRSDKVLQSLPPAETRPPSDPTPDEVLECSYDQLVCEDRAEYHYDEANEICTAEGDPVVEGEGEYEETEEGIREIVRPDRRALERRARMFRREIEEVRREVIRQQEEPTVDRDRETTRNPIPSERSAPAIQREAESHIHGAPMSVSGHTEISTLLVLPPAAAAPVSPVISWNIAACLSCLWELPERSSSARRSERETGIAEETAVNDYHAEGQPAYFISLAGVILVSAGIPISQEIIRRFTEELRTETPLAVMSAAYLHHVLAPTAAIEVEKISAAGEPEKFYQTSHTPHLFPAAFAQSTQAYLNRAESMQTGMVAEGTSARGPQGASLVFSSPAVPAEGQTTWVAVLPPALAPRENSSGSFTNHAAASAKFSHVKVHRGSDADGFHDAPHSGSHGGRQQQGRQHQGRQS